MKRLTAYISIAIAVILVMSFLSACGGDSSTTATTSKPAATTSANSGKVITLRMVESEPANDWIPLSNQKLADEFNAQAKGYKIECYPGQTLVTAAESMDAVRTGAVEMMDTGWGSFSGANPVFGALELPFLYTNIDANAAAQADLLPIMDKAFQQANQKALGSYNIGALEMASVKSVKTMADWKGLIVQAISPECTALISALGGAPSSIPFPEGYSALQKKTIDASMNSPGYMEVGKLYEASKFAVFAYMIPATHGWTINLDIWNKMDQDTQNLLLSLTKKYGESQSTAAKAMYTRLQTDLNTKYGMEVIMISNAERETWAAACRPHVDEILTKLGDNGKTIKTLAEKVNAQYPNK
jgi:TRAP-type C4-dicarboxylate transport system substrate-binding protein